jgi:transcriptional regulator PpsR
MTSLNFAQPDVTLTLDLAGVIRHAALSSTISDEGVEDWVGRAWADTVGEGGDAQVRQVFPSGRELAVEYTTVRLGENAGLIAIGRSLEAVSDLRARLLADQASMERDAWKLRALETRYRLLFETSAQPVLLVSADDTRVLEANPAAIRALGVVPEQALVPEIPAAQREAFLGMLARVREQGKAPGVLLYLGPERRGWLVRASVSESEPGVVFVLQLSPSVPRADRAPGAAEPVRLEDVIARLPEAFVVLDRDGVIRFANAAFAALAGEPDASAVLGRRLGQWLERPGADADAVLERVRREGAFGGFFTTLRRERGESLVVELSATVSASSNEPPAFVGVLLRQRLDPAAEAKRLSKGLLREIVQEMVISVERGCANAAQATVRADGAVAGLAARRRGAMPSEFDRRAAGGGVEGDPRRPPRDD